MKTYLILEEHHPLRVNASVFRIYERMPRTGPDMMNPPRLGDSFDTFDANFSPLYIGRETIREANEFLNERIIERKEAPVLVQFGRRHYKP